MRKERKHFTPEEKVAILRRHLVDRAPVSELCEELGLRPTVFYLSLIHIFAAIVLIIWKRGVCFDANHLKPQTA